MEWKHESKNKNPRFVGILMLKIIKSKVFEV